MRIIAGKARGIVLKAGRGLHIRPTSDRVREAIFSILGEKIIDAFFLDLFAGAGAFAIEALSRGAARAVLVESSRRSLEIIKHNLAVSKLAEQAEVAFSDVFAYIKNAADQKLKFDIIAADPPYGTTGETPLAEKTLLSLRENDIIKDDGIVFIEHNSSEKLSCEGLLKLLSARKYGNTAVSFFRKN